MSDKPRYEYKTTCAETARDRYGNAGMIDYGQPDPIEPAGDDWEMCGAAAGDYALFWFWRRVLPAGDGEGA